MPSSSSPTLRIALVGDYSDDIVAHRAIPLALDAAAAVLDIAVEYPWIATDAVSVELLQDVDAVWVVPGSPYRSMDGALLAIRYARENALPFLGTCGGFQHVIVEYARNVLGWADAGHGETDSEGRLVVTPLSCSLVEKTAMVELRSHTLIARAWGTTEIDGEYRCNYGVADDFIARLDGEPLKVTGWDEQGEVRAVELSGHPFFVATLFQHERAALKGHPAPLVQAFLSAAAR
ncbi:CTP synthase [Entomohabitans teleogrylli]|uniref:CTP synthase C-terminal region-related (seleno)protein n=1 Tax=Entomohabitans teleogrylli TaxID=1384589 RepID=UPI00073D97CF|nr:CTP synthase [Entomohabitans teleogrylli]